MSQRDGVHSQRPVYEHGKPHNAMDAFISRKKRKTTHPEKEQAAKPVTSSALFVPPLEDDDTDIKLATLASLFPHVSQDALLDTLISADGSVEAAVKLLQEPEDEECLRRKNSSPVKGVGYQSSLSSFGLRGTEGPNLTRTLTKRGQTLHLYSPEDIAAHTPCSIIHNFLPTDRAESLLKELLEEAKTFPRQSFKLFDREVQSPHSACFYVGSVEERERQKTEYVYNGSNLTVDLPLRSILEHCSTNKNRIFDS